LIAKQIRGPYLCVGFTPVNGEANLQVRLKDVDVEKPKEKFGGVIGQAPCSGRA
jgi:hypothetical protein